MDERSLQKAVERHGLPSRFVLAVGRITEYKGHDLLIKAMKSVIGEINDVKLVLRIGSETLSEDEAKMKDRLVQMTKELGMEEHVLFYDYVEDIESFYNAAEVYVLPSTYEPFGMVAIEAMACGTPSVLTTQGGLRFLLKDGGDALFVDPVDTEAMAKAIINLIRDRTLYEEISRQGSEKVHSLFTWETIAKKILIVVN
jgi:mannosylfructose-phosphate synthase